MLSDKGFKCKSDRFGVKMVAKRCICHVVAEDATSCRGWTSVETSATKTWVVGCPVLARGYLVFKERGRGNGRGREKSCPPLLGRVGADDGAGNADFRETPKGDCAK